MTQSGKYFYSIKNKSVIQIINDEEHNEINFENIKKNTKTYEDADTVDCTVCLCAEKDTVFIPCGHFYPLNDYRRASHK